MAILRSSDGRFYDVPDNQLEQYAVPPDQVKGMLGGQGQGPGPAPSGGGEVQPYANCPPWRNCFRNNNFRNNFRNCSQFRNCSGHR